MNTSFSSQQTLIGLLEEAAINAAHKNAFTYLITGDVNGPKEQITYSELAQKAKALAVIISQKTKVGDRVLIVLDSDLDYITAFFGCLYAKVIAVPAYPPVTPELAAKLQHIIQDSTPTLSISNTAFLKKFKQFRYIKWAKKLRLDKLIKPSAYKQKFKKITQLCLWDFDKQKWLDINKIKINSANAWQKNTVNADNLAFLQYTSGSTNTPKGVMVTHGNLLHNVELMRKQASFADFKEIRFSCWLPLYHDMGLISGILLPIYLQSEAILMSPFAFLEKPSRWLNVISTYRITHSGAPNFAYDLCVNRISAEEKQGFDLSMWQLAFTGAEPIRAYTLEKFSAEFSPCKFNKKAFYSCYGLAENTLMISGSRALQGPVYLSVKTDTYQQNKIEIADIMGNDTVKTTKLVGSGQLGINCNIKIVDPNTCAILPELAVGEIWSYSPSVTKGYWNKPVETSEIFNAYTNTNEGPFLRTGDLGFIKDGELFITGRLKDLIIINGRNYYPQDIELTTERSHASIRIGSTVAFSTTSLGNERLVVLVEIKKNISQPEQDEIITTIKSAIINNHGVRVFAICLLSAHSLSKTTSGKLRRQAMRTLYEQKQLTYLTHWQENNFNDHSDAEATHFSDQKSQIQQTIEMTVRQILGLPMQQQLSATASFIELGMDSLLITNFIYKLNNNFKHNIEISLEHINQHPNIVTLTKYLEKNSSIPALIKPETKHLEFEKFIHFETIPAYTKLQETISGLETAGLKKLFFNCTSGISDNKIMIDGISYINYSGYNYLGMSGDPIVTEATLKAVKEYGTSVSASRLVSGEKPLNQALENAIANLIGTDESIVFTAGHATNVSVITHLFGENDLIVHDALIHNSSLQGAIFSKATRIPFPHNNFKALDQILCEKRQYHERVVILTEGAFSMDGDIPYLPELIAIKKKHYALLMIDEAHSIGVLGKNGFGIGEHFAVNPQDVDIWMGTLSKALGSCGGYIAANSKLINYLKFGCGGFVYSAGITPANAAAALESVRLLKTQPQRVKTLQSRAKQLLDLLKQAEINTGNSNETPIIPVIVGDERKALQLSLLLRDKQIYAMPIVHPAVEKGWARVRFFVNCKHTTEEIDYTAQAIIDSYKSL